MEASTLLPDTATPTLRRRKPRKSTRSHDISNDTASQASTSAHNNLEKNLTARDRLHAHLTQLKKDRSKGSYACEDNANHEY